MTEPVGERVRPFYCGSQGADWRAVNCENCHKERENSCEIAEAMDAAYFGDGTVSAAIAASMGFTRDAFIWPCPQIAEIIPASEHHERLRLPPMKLAPLWRRLVGSARFALELWVPFWRPVEDIYGVPGRIPLRLAWIVAWGIHRDDRVRA